MNRQTAGVRRHLFRLLFLLTTSLQPAVVSIAASTDLGRVSGLVTFPGETPPGAMFTNRQDHNCPHGIGQNHLIVKQTNRGLKNAIVILEGHEPEGVYSGRTTLAATGCVLTPRVQTVRKTTNLLLKNDDPAAHKLHGYRVGTEFEVSLPQLGSSVRRPLVNEGLYKVNCDKHLWERAWIFVSGDGLAAITDGDGRFEINDVPPGRYQIRVWHEGWVETQPDPEGRLEFQPVGETLEVRVRKGRTTDLLFDQLAPVP